jgi:hypothetical protein
LDWSWCFFEAGYLAGITPSERRPVYCLRPEGVPPPSPIANLQDISSTDQDIERWIRSSLYPLLNRPQPLGGDLDVVIKRIQAILRKISPVKERVLKPNVLITPAESGVDWNDFDRLPEVDFSKATVLIDEESAGRLDLNDPPKTLLTLIKQLDFDVDAYSKGRHPVWVDRFYESMDTAIRNQSEFKEESYFDGETGTYFGL